MSFSLSARGKSTFCASILSDERTPERIGTEIATVNALAAKGMRVAKPIQSRTDEFVESVESEYGLFHAVVFEKLPGEQLELEDLLPEQFIWWGQALGELHNATAQLSSVGSPTWQEQLTLIANILPADERAARQTLAALRQQLDQLPTTAGSYGLIHYDFEPVNPAGELPWMAGLREKLTAKMAAYRAGFVG